MDRSPPKQKQEQRGANSLFLVVRGGEGFGRSDKRGRDGRELILEMYSWFFFLPPLSMLVLQQYACRRWLRTEGHKLVLFLFYFVVSFFGWKLCCVFFVELHFARAFLARVLRT